MTFIGRIAPLGGGEFNNFEVSGLFAFAWKLVILDMYTCQGKGVLFVG